jgi:hypothetical protein
VSIELINEVAKLKTGGGAPTGTGSQFGETAVTRVAKSQFYLTNMSTSHGHHSGSSSYQRGFNHGNGQFSVAAIPFNLGGSTQTQFYVRPFQVNQTTGAITPGTGATVWSGTSSSLQSTMNWGSSGQYGWNFGQHGAPGYSTNTGISTVWSCSGNSVSGTYYTDGVSNWPANGNQDGATSISGGTHYWCPSANNGDPRNLVFSYNGSSISRTRNNSLSGQNTTTNYVYPVVPQFGNQASTVGTIQIYRRSTFGATFNILGPTFDIQSTTSSVGVPFGNGVPSEGIGFELSNGRQLFYGDTFGVMLRNGTSLTNVSATADMIPVSDSRSRNVTPVGVDTWMAVSTSSPREMVKFSINPTTYIVTILGSFPISNLTKNEQVSTNACDSGGIFITGSSNQFVVVINMLSSVPIANVTVGQYTLGGV